MKIVVLGNCQSPVLASCIRAMAPQAEVFSVHLGIDSHSHALDSDIILLQSEFWGLSERRDLFREDQLDKMFAWPTVYHPALHPDTVYATADGISIKSPMMVYNSSIVLYGWINNLSVDDTLALFCDKVFNHLSFYDYEASSDEAFIEASRSSPLDARALLAGWKKRGRFLHTINHPRLFVIADIARELLRHFGIEPVLSDPESYLPDPLLNGPVWPVYPEIGRRLGIIGSYNFKLPAVPGHEASFLDLRTFIEQSFEMYSVYDRSTVVVDRLLDQSDKYEALELVAKSKANRSANPYAGLPDYCYWRKSIGSVSPSDIDPVTKPKFQIAPAGRISTGGSCFAQHIARVLRSKGDNFFAAEPAPDGMPEDRAAELGYNMYSARFGNVYTPRQLLQLFNRAYGEFLPIDTAWRRADGRFIDPFRPQINPDGYASEGAVWADRDAHLAAVRRMFEQSDVFIFTVGLTETWEAIGDGAVFPVAPGVVASGIDSAEYRFVNFRTAEIEADLDSFFEKVKQVNPAIKFILTVSPVPLIATYEDRNVLVSTTYSKAAIRAAVDNLAVKRADVEYFPSFEIIMQNRGAYFADDQRSVTDAGVDHVMRLFISHYMKEAPAPISVQAPKNDAIRREIARSAKVICDEELLDATP